MSVGMNTNLSSVNNLQYDLLNNNKQLNNTISTVGQKSSVGNDSLFNSTTDKNNNNDNNILKPVNSNYDEDIMMPDFLKSNTITAQTANNLPQQNQVEENTVSQSFGNNPQATKSQSQIDEPQLTNTLLKCDKNLSMTENDNSYKRTDIAKTSLGILGFLAPAAGKIIDFSKGGKFSELFKFKQLGIACPAVALAGFGVGAMIDSYINSTRAKAADEAAKQDNNVYQPMNLKA